MAMRLCSVCAKHQTGRQDGLCDPCWRARQEVETSIGQATFIKIIKACEADWSLMDRIDHDWRKRHSVR